MSAIEEVRAERERQDEKWGEQNHLDFFGPSCTRAMYGVRSEASAKRACEDAFANGNGTWAHVFVEEVAEVMACAPSSAELRAELIQVAAVAVAWVEALDRRGAA